MNPMPLVNGDIASSLSRVAAIGTKLSTALLSYACEVADADKNMTDFAGDVALTSNVLTNVGSFLAEKDNSSVPTPQALKDAHSILTRCHKTFNEIKTMVDKNVKSKTAMDGKSKFGKRARLLWPAKSNRAELLKTRLDSLKTSLLLLLQVLSLAKEHESGTLEPQVLSERFEAIRGLRARQQETLLPTIADPEDSPETNPGDSASSARASAANPAPEPVNLDDASTNSVVDVSETPPRPAFESFPIPKFKSISSTEMETIPKPNSIDAMRLDSNNEASRVFRQGRTGHGQQRSSNPNAPHPTLSNPARPGPQVSLRTTPVSATSIPMVPNPFTSNPVTSNPFTSNPTNPSPNISGQFTNLQGHIQRLLNTVQQVQNDLKYGRLTDMSAGWRIGREYVNFTRNAESVFGPVAPSQGVYQNRLPQQGQQGQQKTPQQKQQQLQHQQYPGQMNVPPMSVNGQPPPPPPPNMPPPFGNQLPPLRMQGHTPPGAMQGGRPTSNAPLTQIFNTAPPRKPRKQKFRHRSQSPRTRNQLRDSMDALGNIDMCGQIKSDSESDTSSSSVDTHHVYDYGAKQYHKDGYKIPRSPRGPYASGTIPRRLTDVLMKRRSLPARDADPSSREGLRLRSASREARQRLDMKRAFGNLSVSDDDVTSASDSEYEVRGIVEVDCFGNPYVSDSERINESESSTSTIRDPTRRHSRMMFRERSDSDDGMAAPLRDPLPRSKRPKPQLVELGGFGNNGDSSTSSKAHDSRRRRRKSTSRNRYDRRSSMREHRQPDAYSGISPPPQKQEQGKVPVGTEEDDIVNQLLKRWTNMPNPVLPAQLEEGNVAA